MRDCIAASRKDSFLLQIKPVLAPSGSETPRIGWTADLLACPCSFVISKRYVVAKWVRVGRKRAVGQRQVRHHIEVQNVIAVHEHDLTSLSGI